MPTFPSPRVVGVGEAMVEFAPVGDALYRRGFAGDTLNTCWHMAQLLGERAQVGYCTRLGNDAFSNQLVDFLAASGIDTRAVSRDPERSIGLYVIGLAGAERSFSYWRETSAARRLADDPEALRAALQGCALIHVSGITLAVIGEAGRAKLMQALADARAGGARVAFDPNVRLRLWRDADAARQAFADMFDLTDIALPSFDDEALVWGDVDPQATVARLARAGVAEIVVKNGAGEVVSWAIDVQARTPTPPVAILRDTTGAGDAFNAGYLAARHVGQAPGEAVAFAQRLAGEVVGHFGALAPPEALVGFRQSLARLAPG